MSTTTTERTPDPFWPVGWKYTLLAASLAKRIIATQSMKAGDRLRFLEILASYGDGTVGISAAAVAAVEPADPISAEIIEQAMSLDRDMWDGSPEEIAAKRRARPRGTPDACTVLTAPDLFGKLLRLNPSLYTALDLCGPQRAR